MKKRRKGGKACTLSLHGENNLACFAALKYDPSSVALHSMGLVICYSFFFIFIVLLIMMMV